MKVFKNYFEIMEWGNIYAVNHEMSLGRINLLFRTTSVFVQYKLVPLIKSQSQGKSFDYVGRGVRDPFFLISAYYIMHLLNENLNLDDSFGIESEFTHAMPSLITFW
jgi:hypothetical protein